MPGRGYKWVVSLTRKRQIIRGRNLRMFRLNWSQNTAQKSYPSSPSPSSIRSRVTARCRVSLIRCGTMTPGHAADNGDGQGAWHQVAWACAARPGRGRLRDSRRAPALPHLRAGRTGCHAGNRALHERRGSCCRARVQQYPARKRVPQRAWADKMYLGAAKKSAGRPAKNSPQIAANLRSDDEVVKTLGISGDTLRRVASLTALVPTLMDRWTTSRSASRRRMRLRRYVLTSKPCYLMPWTASRPRRRDARHHVGGEKGS